MQSVVKHVKCASVLWLLPLAVWATEIDAERLFKDGNQFYQEGQFAQALECYAKLDSLGYQSGALYYNIGNTYYRLGAIGYAILYYEKAAKLIGEDEDLRTNLELARLRTKDRIQPIPRFFLDAFVESLLQTFSMGAAAVGTVLSFYLLIGIVIMQIQKYAVNQVLLKVGFYVTLVATVFFILIFSAKSARDAARTEAIVISATLNLKSEPNHDSKTLVTVHEGLKVEIVREVNEWVEIRLPNGEKGWTKAGDVALI